MPGVHYTCLGGFIVCIFWMVPHSQLIQEGPKSPVQSVAFGIICKAGCRGAPHPAGWSVHYTRGEMAVRTGIGSLDPLSSGGLYPHGPTKISYHCINV